MRAVLRSWRALWPAALPAQFAIIRHAPEERIALPAPLVELVEFERQCDRRAKERVVATSEQVRRDLEGIRLALKFQQSLERLAQRASLRQRWSCR